jgi:hypothetical protein
LRIRQCAFPFTSELEPCTKSKPVHFDDLAELLRKGHLRRSADFGRWLRQHLAGSTRTERDKEARTQLLSTITALMLRLAGWRSKEFGESLGTTPILCSTCK